MDKIEICEECERLMEKGTSFWCKKCHKRIIKKIYDKVCKNKNKEE